MLTHRRALNLDPSCDAARIALEGQGWGAGRAGLVHGLEMYVHTYAYIDIDI